MIRLPRLYAVADAAFGDPVDLAKALFDGGVTLVQIRHKVAAAGTLLREIDDVLKFAPPHAQVIVNDRPDVARIAGASGVHLGQEDLGPLQARMVLAEGQVIGCSTHDLPQALNADNGPADYIAVGPVFATSTKKNAAPVLGLRRLEEICSRIHKPVVAIGGITLDSATDVFNCGVASVAVIGDLFKHGNVADRTRDWVRRVES
jgi:thiamine-phosphate pyrophosphorylase